MVDPYRPTRLHRKVAEVPWFGPAIVAALVVLGLVRWFAVRPRVIARVADDGPLRAGGLGLHLTRKLSLDIGWYVANGTKHVWAQVAIPGPLRCPTGPVKA
jgi:hypothetical protein